MSYAGVLEIETSDRDEEVNKRLACNEGRCIPSGAISRRRLVNLVSTPT